MTVSINPGSGPVEQSDLENAHANIQQFITDVKNRHGYKTGSYSLVRQEDDGRFTFITVFDGTQFEVEMPGWPLENVRWVDDPDQNIWDFPRLYVDGSSWVWKFAVNVCCEDEE